MDGHANPEDLQNVCEREPKVDRLKVDTSYVHDLIEVLLPQPQGLRRWSVMRAIRARREKTDHEIPLKFENEVERAFRRFCADDPIAAIAKRPDAALFFRPKEKAGEVWAVNAERAKAWLDDPLGAQQH